MKGRNFYQIMGVTRDASLKEIKHAYRLLARKYHPDVSDVSDATEKFKAMGEAYAVLKNPDTRKQYDQRLRQKSKQQRPPQQKKQAKRKTNNTRTSRGHTTSRRFNEQKFNERHAAELNRSFTDLFGSNKKNNTESRFDVSGKHLYARLIIGLEHSMTGTSQQFTVEIPIYTPRGEIVIQHKTLNVNIPRGILEGDTIRLTNQGMPGMGSAAGDYVLQVEFYKHDFYRIEGRDIFLTLAVSEAQLEFGTTLQIPSPNKHLGNVTVNIPPKSQHGAMLRFDGHGLPSAVTGDFYTVLQATAS